MKRIAPIVVLALLAAHLLQAQTTEEKIQAARIGYITQRLNLTPEQAQQFWPVFNEYENKRQGLNKEIERARSGINFSNMSDEKANELIELSLKRKEAELALEQEFVNKLKGVITPVQVLKLIKAEQDFKQELLNRIRQRQQQGVGPRRRFGGGGR